MTLKDNVLAEIRIYAGHLEVVFNDGSACEEEFVSYPELLVILHDILDFVEQRISSHAEAANSPPPPSRTHNTSSNPIRAGPKRH